MTDNVFSTTQQKLPEDKIISKYQNCLAIDAFNNVIHFDPSTTYIVEDENTVKQFKEHLRVNQGVIFADGSPEAALNILEFLDDMDAEAVSQDITIQYVREFDSRTGNFFLISSDTPFRLDNELYRRLISTYCRKKSVAYGQIRRFAEGLKDRETGRFTTVYEA